MILPDGWLSEDEAAELGRLGAGRTVLELGAWKGRSTVVLAGVAEYVVSVDRHRGIPDVEYSESLLDYLGAVRDLANVAIVIAEFEKLVPLLDSFFDLCFVDGDHDAQSVARDTQLAMEHVCTAGVIAFHDWDFASVRKGVRRIIGTRKPDNLIGSVASFSVS